jgi:serine/threonine-protein kinase
VNQERWERLQTLFANACQLPADQQLSYLQANAAGDEELISAVGRMLENDAKASFLDREIGSIATDVLEQPELLPFENIGPYRLMDKLGAGGMGVVYLAEREDWQSQVAIKVPRDIWISSDRVKRFADEQRLLAQLVHPLIARIYEGGTLGNGTPWFAMEYVEGEPITRYCQSQGHSIRQRLHLFVSVCDAVQYAHTHAIIHRDLKPSNILVTASGRIKLLDFGIAKQLGDSGKTSETMRLGQHPVTLAYAAPEQVLLNQISTQTDVYSLGVVRYELLTENLPLDLSDLTPAQAEKVIRTKEPEKPSSVAQQANGKDAADDTRPKPSRSEWADLNVPILTAMHRDLAKRYGSVDALRRDIVHYLNYEPLDARADTLPYRLSKFVRRRRIALAFSAAALLLLVSLIAFYTIRLAKARDAAITRPPGLTRRAGDKNPDL